MHVILQNYVRAVQIFYRETVFDSDKIQWGKFLEITDDKEI